VKVKYGDFPILKVIPTRKTNPMKKSTKTGISAGTVAILLGLQSLLTGIHASRPSCQLAVHHSHVSSSVKGSSTKDALKINATTTCTRDQLNSKLTMSFFRIKGSESIRVAYFPEVVELADSSDHTKAYFKRFFKKCITFNKAKYYAYARGEVTLSNGKKLKVSGKSTKYPDLDCFI
jgi:hypothetical protein